MTTPLLTTKTGEKLGKSAGNAVWLDESKTSHVRGGGGGGGPGFGRPGLGRGQRRLQPRCCLSALPSRSRLDAHPKTARPTAALFAPTTAHPPTTATLQFELYQYFLRVDDADVERMLLMLTEAPEEEVQAAARALQERPEARDAQRLLADRVVRLLRGDAGVASAQRVSARGVGG